MPASPSSGSASPVPTSGSPTAPPASSKPASSDAAAAASESSQPRTAQEDDEDDDEDDEVVTSTESLPPRSSKPAAAVAGAQKGKGGRTQDEKDDIFRQRKRDREGSLEPGKATGTGLSTPDAIPTKKNRLGSGSFPLSSAPGGDNEEDYFVGANESPLLGSGGASGSKGTRAEGEKVGQIRERVRDLSWKGTGAPPEDEEVHEAEGKKDEEAHEAEGKKDEEAHIDDAPMGETPALPDVPEADETTNTEQPQEDKEMHNTPAASKPTPPTFASFASKSSGFAAAKGDALSAAPVVPPPSASAAPAEMEAEATPPASASGSTSLSPAPAPAPAAVSPARTQPTFSAFSSGSSPFSSSSASVAGPSWLAGKSSGGSSPFASASGSGVRPSTLGSLGATATDGGSGRSSLSPTPGAATPASTSTSTGGKQLGFGAFASSSGFGAGASAARSNGTASPAAFEEPAGASNGKAKESTGTGASAFEDKLLREAGSAPEFGKAENKVALPLAEEKDLTTGEEDERTVTSARAKLYTMDTDNVWKERGTGTVRCNIPKSLLERKKGGRLVMRAEGVYRLILNVALFKGMRLELAEKFVRLVAIEEGKYVHFAIKFSTPAAATSFRDAVNAHIPKGETGVAPVAGDDWA